MAVAVMSQAPPMITPAAANAINPRRFMVSPSVTLGISAANKQQIACHSAIVCAARPQAGLPACGQLKFSAASRELPNIYVQQQSLRPFATKTIAAIGRRLRWCLRYVSAKGSGSLSGGEMGKTLRIIDIGAE